MNDNSPLNQDQTTGSSGIDVIESARSRVGEITVRRALPRRKRRMIGQRCFIEKSQRPRIDVSPPPWDSK